MLDIVVVDTSKKIITLEDTLLTVQNQRGKILASGNIDKFIILYYEKVERSNTEKYVFQLPPKRAIACEFGSEQSEEFEQLYTKMKQCCQEKSYSSYLNALNAHELTEMQKKVISKYSDDSIKPEPIKPGPKETKQKSNQAKCPRCGSISLTAQKQGFGIGKAVVGTALFGVIGGAVAGSMGAKKIEVTCLNCGKRFKI